ncbi:MAG: AhpC/TSA family protein [Haliscomenobacter sp.]|nr:AhpC/TSA family protein [Haliscomenobacter sp.]
MEARDVNLSILGSMITNTGDSLMAWSARQPVLLVFLRHFGCTFCREALSDISKRQEEIERQGTKIIFVHMTDEATAEAYFQKYDLAGAVHISDPECRYYQAFGLVKGNFTQLFGLATWIRGFSAGVVSGHGIGPQIGDGFQMPGVFVIQDGSIKGSFVHELASDRPDYLNLVKCCEIN